MRRVWPFMAVLLSLALATAGCAGPGAQFRPGEGWRTGTILEIGVPATLTRPIDADCRRLYSDEVFAEQPFALVQYFSGKAVHVRTVPVPEGSSAKVGDAVLVNLGRCRTFASR